MAKKKYFYVIKTDDWNPRIKRYQDGNFIVKINREGFKKTSDGRLSYSVGNNWEFAQFIDDWYGTINKARKEMRKMRGT